MSERNRVKQNEKRLAIYPGGDAYAIIEARAKKRGLSANVYAKELLIDSLRRSDVLEAMNYLGEAMTKLSRMVEELQRQVVTQKDLNEFKEAMRRNLNDIAEAINQ